VTHEVGDRGIAKRVGKIGLGAVELSAATNQAAELAVVDVVEVVCKPERLDDVGAGCDAGAAAAGEVPAVIRGTARRPGACR